MTINKTRSAKISQRRMKKQKGMKRPERRRTKGGIGAMQEPLPLSKTFSPTTDIQESHFVSLRERTDNEGRKEGRKSRKGQEK
jgi:hypothetical protein